MNIRNIYATIRCFFFYIFGLRTYPRLSGLRGYFAQGQAYRKSIDQIEDECVLNGGTRGKINFRRSDPRHPFHARYYPNGPHAPEYFGGLQ